MIIRVVPFKRQRKSQTHARIDQRANARQGTGGERKTMCTCKEDDCPWQWWCTPEGALTKSATFTVQPSETRKFADCSKDTHTHVHTSTRRRKV